MIDIPSKQQADVYRKAFVHNCLLLLVRARADLAGSPLASAEEPAITGLLVKHAKQLTESPDAESWLEHLEVNDDPPQNDLPGRLGKSRPRIDIEFVETGRGRRPRFHVESKRLYRTDSASEYFGEGGLGMFLTGAYASGWPSAGMLGYVQSRNCSHWKQELALKLDQRKSEAKSCADRPLMQSAGWSTSGLADVVESCHERTPRTLGRIGIYHLLIDFC